MNLDEVLDTAENLVSIMDASQHVQEELLEVMKALDVVLEKVGELNEATNKAITELMTKVKAMKGEA